jgi:hypothetical protein
MMYLWVSYKKIFLTSLKSLKKGIPEPDPDPDPLGRGTDPGIRVRNRIRAKMSRISNTGFNRWTPYGIPNFVIFV